MKKENTTAVSAKGGGGRAGGYAEFSREIQKNLVERRLAATWFGFA